MEIKFESPQQEALEIALETRRKILEGKTNILEIIRRCFVVANNLSKKEDLKWIKCEMDGSWTKEETPSYRKLSIPLTKKFSKEDKDFESIHVKSAISSLEYHFDKKDNITLCDIGAGKEYLLRPDHDKELIDRIINKCLTFLTECVSELQYSGYVQSIFENLRKFVDKKLLEFDKNISEELNSIYLNLISNNSSDWIKVPHSCRRILKFVADKVFPPSEDKYKTPDNREWEVKEGNFLNRLICYAYSDSISKTSISEISLLEKYFRLFNEEVQNGEHKKEISKEDASLIAVRTYLILSEIIKDFK